MNVMSRTRNSGFQLIVVAVAAAIVASCGTPPGAGGTGGGGSAGGSGGTGGGTTIGTIDQEVVSGSRLKARVIRGVDGSMSAFAGHFFDSQRNEDCSPKLASDGKVRCTPDSVIQDWFDDLGAALAYAYPDANCQMPTLGNSAYGPTETRVDAVTGIVSNVGYLIEYDSTGKPTKYFSPGTEYTGTLYRKSGTGPCTSAQRQPGRHYYPRGTETAVTEFVEMTPGLL